jgi:outer membrane protein assembly complex protein YaeT
MEQKPSIRILAVVLCLVIAYPVRAITLDALDAAKEWRVEKIEISGNQRIPADTLLTEILTKARPWYSPWQERPSFDPITFENDLERLRRFYEARGFYGTQVSYDLNADEDKSLVTARIDVTEGAPVVIADIEVTVSEATDKSKRPPLPETLPVKRDEVFEEEKYQAAEDMLRRLFLRHAFAHAQIQRRAEVDLVERKVRISYIVEPGPKSTFGPTEISGTDKVDPGLVRREISYSEGEAFSPAKIAETRAKILSLGLFGTVRTELKEVAGKPAVVPMVIEVTEKPHREVKIGVGYSTEDEFRGQVEWRHLNWLGGGRQLSLQAKYSSIVLTGAVNLVQPHFFSPRTKAVLSLRHDQEQEDTYLRNVTRFTPRLDHRFSAALTGFLGYRLGFNKLNNIEAATERALGEVRREGILSGPTLGLVWDTTDDLFLPKRGEVLSFSVEHAGSIWGGPYRFVKIKGEAKKYIAIGWETTLASRLEIGLADSIGADDRFPLFERFFAGGEKSVRGYGRRRLGPLSAADDPLGGLSLIEGSLELRRPIWRDLGGAVFLDFGQVSLRSFDPPLSNLKFSSGFGLSYATPVGPLRLDIGFPFERPPGERPWQIHFSIGAFF